MVQNEMKKMLALLASLISKKVIAERNLKDPGYSGF
jgi:hypothetical protein